MFLSSIGFSAYIIHSNPALLMLAVMTIPANWSASSAAVEHVISQLSGKKALNVSATDPDRASRIYLGTTTIQATAAEKQSSPLRLIVTIAQEILSYYGQFSFFGALLLIDFLTRRLQGDRLLVTTSAFLLLGTALACRIPLRMAREFRRARLMDPTA